MTKIRLPLPRALHRLLAERDGVAVVEFAFVAPIMLFILVASVDLGNAITTSRKITAAAQSAADLVSQEGQLSDAEVDNAFNAFDMMLSPFDAAERNATIYSVVMDEDDGSISVDWEEHRGFTPPSATTIDLPDGLLTPGNSIIVVKANYNHQTFLGGMLFPMMGAVGSSSYQMEDEAFLHPRRVPFIPRVTN
jgi:Flp pilus assembly protein TadG